MMDDTELKEFFERAVGHLDPIGKAVNDKFMEKLGERIGVCLIITVNNGKNYYTSQVTNMEHNLLKQSITNAYNLCLQVESEDEKPVKH